jgi:hypothetical protein
MPVEFKQIRIDKDIREKYGEITIILLTIIFIVVLFLLINVFHLRKSIVVVSSMLFFLVSFVYLKHLIRVFFPDWARKSDVIGKISFDQQIISWIENGQKEIVNVNEINEIRFHYNYVQGGQFKYYDIIHNGLALLILKTKSDKELKIKCLIEKKDQLKSLFPIWKEYYKMGIKVREMMGNGKIRTILFDRKLTSIKIKKLKEELNVSSFF